MAETLSKIAYLESRRDSLLVEIRHLKLLVARYERDIAIARHEAMATIDVSSERGLRT